MAAAGSTEWVIKPRDVSQERHLAQALGIHPVLAGLLVSRGFDNPAAAQAFVPGDLIDRHGVDRGALAKGDITPGLVAALAEFRRAARDHLGLAEAAAGRLANRPRAVLLPLALLRPTLDRMDRLQNKPFGTGAELAPWRRQWLIWKAARRF